MAKQITGLIDDFDMQSEIDNKRFNHQKQSIGDSVAVLPRFGRIPDLPTMPMVPQRQRVQNPGSMGLYMGLAQAGMSAASTFAQFSPKGPKLDPKDIPGGGNSNFDSWYEQVINEPYDPLNGSQF